MKTENGTYPSAAEQFYSMVILVMLIIYGLRIKISLIATEPHHAQSCQRYLLPPGERPLP